MKGSTINRVPVIVFVLLGELIVEGVRRLGEIIANRLSRQVVKLMKQVRDTGVT